MKKKMNRSGSDWKRGPVWVMAVVLCGFFAANAAAQQEEIVANGLAIRYTPGTASSGMTLEDMAAAVAMPLPQSQVEAQKRWELDRSPAKARTPGFVAGAPPSSTKQYSTFVPLSRAAEGQPGQEEYGTSEHPFTTSRVDLLSGNKPSRWYPYAPTGKLYFKIGTGSYVCSASLIKRGLIVTAAHCVTDFGGDWYSDWLFVPALSGTSGVSQWTGLSATVVLSYKNGTDTCAAGASGVVCENDLAVIVLKGKLADTKYPGDTTGWYGYGYDGFGFTPANEAQITQLGYPVSHDSGNRMQRTDSLGFVDATLANNTVWGSRQTGGSSGGPELVNFGILAALSGTAVGSEATMNTVVGVTSWGYTSGTVKQQGASSFTSGNIVPLVTAGCTGGATTYCKP
jgi:V8-like Glu-specific endopeptidase